jgi:hypothetical protein
LLHNDISDKSFAPIPLELITDPYLIPHDLTVFNATDDPTGELKRQFVAELFDELHRNARLFGRDI